jgi:hypothetical protein
MRVVLQTSAGLLAAAYSMALSAACDVDSVTSAERKWSRNAPEHYTYIVSRETPLTATYKGVPIPRGARVEVKSGIVKAMWYVHDQDRRHRSGRSIPKSIWEQLRFSPSSLFEELHNSMAWASGSMDHLIGCSFDPDTGLLVRLHTDSRSLSDSYDLLEVTDFRVLP